MVKKDYLKAIYPRDEETGGYIIDISLDNYDDLFNEWDRSPLRRRDLDPELYNFLEESSEEIPLKFPLVIVLHLPNGSRIIKREESLLKGWKNFYSFNAHLIARDINASNRKAFLYVLVAFFFFLSAYFFKPFAKDLLYFDILLEGVFVGGWVFLWEAFSLAFFESKKLYKKRKEYQRLLNSKIKFSYDIKSEI